MWRVFDSAAVRDSVAGIHIYSRRSTLFPLIKQRFFISGSFHYFDFIDNFAFRGQKEQPANSMDSSQVTEWVTAINSQG
jgi:hypothetical protein